VSEASAETAVVASVADESLGTALELGFAEHAVNMIVATHAAQARIASCGETRDFESKKPPRTRWILGGSDADNAANAGTLTAGILSVLNVRDKDWVH